MELSQLIKIKTKSKKRIGRGESSGKGKTSGRGAKGQKKRGKVALGFEGGQLPIYLRLPQQRGIGNKPRVKSITVSTDQLNKLSTKEPVTEKNLQENDLVPRSSNIIKVKIVAAGKLEKALQVNLPTSKKAKEIIENAGGKVTYENSD